jgi:ParB-like chromosome segregation protein Spo0J
MPKRTPKKKKTSSESNVAVRSRSPKAEVKNVPHTTAEVPFSVGVMKKVPIGLVVPYEQNPRKIPKSAIAVVRKSIEKFGYNVPIVVDSDMVIVTGHTRFCACKEMGMTHVHVVIADHLTKKQASEFRIADNRIGEMATWDDSLLIPELRAVGTEGEMDVFFKSGEMEKLLGSLAKADINANTPTQDQIDKQSATREGHFTNKSTEDDKKIIQVQCQHCGEGFGVDRRLALSK